MRDRILWPLGVAALGFLYGYYDFAIGRTGEVFFAFAGATAICLIGMFWQRPGRAGMIAYELSVLALWIGGYMFSFPYLSRFVYGWMICASVGGLIMCVARGSKSGSATTRRTLAAGSVAALLVQAALVMAGFAQLVLIEKRPHVSFRALGNPLLESLAFSVDGKRLATVGGFGLQLKTVTLWDAETGGKLTEIADTNVTGDPKLARLHFVGDRLALAIRADGRTSIAVLDVRKHGAKARFEWADEVCGGAATFSRDGTRFVYANFEGRVRVFDLKVGKVTVDLHRMGDQVNCLAVSRSNDKVACAVQGDAIEVWGLSNSGQIATLSSTANVECMEFSADGCLLACGTDAATVEVFDLTQLRRVVTVRCFGDGIISALAFSPNGEILACGGSRGVTALVDPKLGEARGKLRMWGAWELRCISFSTDGKTLATGNLRGDIAIWQFD